MTNPKTPPGDGQSTQEVNITATDGGLAVGNVESLNVQRLQVILQAAAEQMPSPPVLAIDSMRSDEPPFVGRQEELDLLFQMLGLAPDGPSTVVITGPAGVGKTALARQAAMSPGGAGAFTYALFVDMRGYEVHQSNRANPDGVYSSLLRRLGVPNDDIPASPGDQGTVYHQVMEQLAAEGKPVLLWLDNVSDPSQFELLRPSGSVHKLLTTTRETFGGIPSHAVVDLDVLSPEEAIELLRASARDRNPGDDRFDQQPDATAELVELCDRLPLALQIVAALLADEPTRSVPELVSELAAEERRLDGLHYDDRLSVRAALTLSYRRLPAALQRLFRLMSAVPGGDVGLDAARWLIESSDPRPQLMALVRAHLIQQHVRDRWRMHDLVRLFATEEAAADRADADRAYKSIVNHYLLAVGAATEWLTAVSSDTGKRFFPSPEAAAVWMERERATAIAIVKSAVNRPDYFNIAAYLGVILGDLLKAERHLLNDFYDVAAITASIAMKLQDKRIAACTLNNFGSALRLRGEFSEALTVLQQAVDLNEENGDVPGASTSRTNIANVLVDQKKYDDAIALYRADIKVCRESDPPWPHNEAGTLTNLAAAYGLVGRLDDALDALRQAVAIRREMKGLAGLANSLLNLGTVLQQAAEANTNVPLMREAVMVLKEALAIYRDRLKSESGQALVANNLGVAQCELRMFGPGMANMQAAIEYFDRSGQTARATATREALADFRRFAEDSA